MKKLLSIFCLLLVSTVFCFAQEPQTNKMNEIDFDSPNNIYVKTSSENNPSMLEVYSLNGCNEICIEVKDATSNYHYEIFSNRQIIMDDDVLTEGKNVLVLRKYCCENYILIVKNEDNKSNYSYVITKISF
jgi:hypothetical protein